MKADEKFRNIDFSSENLDDEYDNCSFHSCDFAETDLSKKTFIECEFKDCNLTLAKIDDCGFKDVTFIDCKMLGMKFNRANTFLLQLHFESCHLAESSFYQLNLKSSSFQSCNLESVDFGETSLENSSVIQCKLSDARFDRTDLQGADLTGSYDFQIDPEKNKIFKAKFSKETLMGLLHKYDLRVDNQII